MSMDDIESIANEITNWMDNVNWNDSEAADRVTGELNRGPDKLIDSSLSASANYDIIKDKSNIQPENLRRSGQRDVEDQQIQFALDEIESQFQEYGMEAVADAYDQDRLAPPELQGRFDDVFTEYGPDLYREIAYNEIGRVIDAFEMDAELLSGPRLESLREQAEQSPGDMGQDIRDAERQVLDRLEVAFGQRFDDLDDAVESLRDRIDALQDLDVRSGAIRLRGNRDARPSVAVEIGFGQFEQAVREQVDRAIDRDALADLPRTFEQRVGSVRVVGDEIQTIDLTPIQIDRELTRAVIDSDELLVRFEIDADVDVVTPPAPEVPEPPEFAEEEPDTEDETPTPEPEETPVQTDGVDDDLLNIVDRATRAADRGLGALADEISTGDLFELAAAIDRDQLPDDVKDALLPAFQQAGLEDRSNAAAANPGVGELQRAVIGMGPGEAGDMGELDIEFDPDGDISDLIDEAEPDRDDSTQDTITDPSDDPEQGPLDPEDIVGGRSGLADHTSGIRAQPGSNRPDPNQQDADKKLMTLLSNRLMKAQAWIAAEQERISRGPEDPRVFWQTRGSSIWGNTLTEREFVNLTTDGLQ